MEAYHYFFLWFIWKWRNHIIFQERKDPFIVVFDNIVSSIDSISAKSSQGYKSNQSDFPTNHLLFPRVFFDGASQNDIFGCSVHIIMENNLQYQIYWNDGMDSNIKAEAMALASLLSMCHFLNIQSLQIYGDSKVIIEHVTEKNHIKNQCLDGWMNRIMTLWRGMEGYSICHIYRSQNVQADILSKKGLLSHPGIWNMEVILEAESFHIQEFYLPGS